MRREDGLVLAPQQRRHMAGQPAEHDVSGVYDMPLSCDVTVLRAESAHSRKPSHVVRDPGDPAVGPHQGPSLHPHPRRVRRTERSVLLVADDAHAAYSETARSAKAHRAAAHGCEDIVGLAYLISKTTALITPYGGDTVTMRDQIVA